MDAGEAAGGTMLYSLDGEQFSADIPTSTATGSYMVYYKVQGDANHEDTEAQSVIAAIGKKDITISGIQAEDKVYDGTTAVTLSYDAVVFGGIAEGDALTVTAKGTFVDANVGTNKEVTITEIVLDGQSIANYQLAESGQQTTATACGYYPRGERDTGWCTAHQRYGLQRELYRQYQCGYGYCNCYRPG